MALTTSGANANAYEGLTWLDAYFAARDNSTWDAATDEAKEAAAIEATQYIDANYRYAFVGHIQTTTQALEWPRVNAVDSSGRTLSGIPTAIKNAMAELALSALSGPLVPAQERGGRVTQEKVGPISITYADSAPAGRTFDFADSLLSGVLKKGGKHRLVRT